MSEQHTAKDTHSKALAINLEGAIYGSFAEIGAGQEVARWFLTAGAASGTVAQTISAYDKAVSDDTYGAGTRYVSRERLMAMLDHEYKLLVERLGPTRGEKTRFFAFANTVATRNYKGDNEQHGWVGLRFQSEPKGETSDVLLHVNLMDATAAKQQEALGIFGVNLLYAAHYDKGVDAFLEGLWDGLGIDRLEIDVLDFSGPAFAGEDPAKWCLQLLRRKMGCAILFDAAGKVVEPSGVLRKRPLIVDRGRFETVEPFHQAMLKSAERALRAEGAELSREPQGVLEMALNPVLGEDMPDDATALARVRNMLSVGPALVTDIRETFHLIPYLRRHTHEPIRLVGGVALLARMMQSQYYHELPGELLEGMGKLFASNVTFYVYPMPRDAVEAVLGMELANRICRPGKTGLIGTDDLVATAPLSHLYRYLREAGRVMPIEWEGGKVGG